MKKIRFISIFMSAVLVLGATGCSDWLTVKPESQIILEEFWQSESDVQSVVNACYRGLTTDDCMYRMMVWGEIRSDNIIPRENNVPDDGILKILTGELTSTNPYAKWGSFYSIINYTNTILKYAPDVVNRDKNFSPADLKKVQAETRAIRALCYFYLIRSFRDVPWVDEASIDDTQDYRPKASEYRVVMDHIIDDLVFAKQYIPADFGRTDFNKGRFTLTAVNALMADVYLWDQQYDKCVQAADLVLANKNLELIGTKFNNFYQVFYRGQSTETILELQFDPSVQNNDPVNLLYGSQAEPIGELGFPLNLAFDPYSKDPSAVHSPFYFKPVTSPAMESEFDIRAKDSYISDGDKFYIFKYPGMIREDQVVNGRTMGLYDYRSETPNWILYRLADVILMKAEALVQLGDSVSNQRAIELVNKTYLRSNTTSDGKTVADSLKLENYKSKEELSRLVLRERHRELLFEGKRWFDLVRWSRREGSTGTLNEYLTYKLSNSTFSLGAATLDAMYMPIAESELVANKNLVQNPYYKTAASSSQR